MLPERLRRRYQAPPQERFPMAYVAGKLGFVVLRPSNLMLLLALLGVGGLWWRRRWGMAVTSAAILGIAACTVLPVGRWLTIPLENRFPHPTATPDASMAPSCSGAE